MYDSLPISNVMILLNSQIRYFQIDLARRIKSENNIKIHAYCKTEQEKKFYESQNNDGTFDSIVVADKLIRATNEKKLDWSSEIQKARIFERRFDVTYNTLALANRHLGQGYALGGFYHPRSHQSENTDYLQMVHGYNDEIQFWLDQFSNKAISLVIGGESKVVSVIARNLGVPYRALARIRLRNNHYWVENEHREAPAAEKHFANIKVDEHVAATLDGAYLQAAKQYDRVLKQIVLPSLIYRIVHDSLQHLYWRMRGYEKARGYYLYDKLMFHIRQRNAILFMMGKKTVQLKDLQGKPFIFYPLHTEPETALGQVSPEFYVQLEAISTLSRDLPAGVMLAVKEAPIGAGRRPANFYDQILRHKNVVMININERGHEIIKHASAAATIVGTAGFEAAVAGKPVISFGQHNSFNFLPHVRVVKTHSDLKMYLEEIFTGKINLEQARRDGARFIKAIEMSSFDMGNFDYYRLKSYDTKSVENAYAALMASLG